MVGTGYEWIGTRKSWIQIGPYDSVESSSTGGGEPVTWQIDLDLNHGRSLPVFVFAVILLGIIFATPVFHGGWSPAEMSDVESKMNFVSSILFGFASALILLALPVFPSLTEWVRDNP